MYSPSQSTLSDEDDLPPLPPEWAPKPPPPAQKAQVLGSNLAKKRLQAFKQIKAVNRKIKPAGIFAEDGNESDDGDLKKQVEAKKKKEPELPPKASIAAIMETEMLEKNHLTELRLKVEKIKQEQVEKEREREERERMEKEREQEEKGRSGPPTTDHQQQKLATKEPAKRNEDPEEDLREVLRRRREERRDRSLERSRSRRHRDTSGNRGRTRSRDRTGDGSATRNRSPDGGGSTGKARGRRKSKSADPDKANEGGRKSKKREEDTGRSRPKSRSKERVRSRNGARDRDRSGSREKSPSDGVGRGRKRVGSSRSSGRARSSPGREGSRTDEQLSTRASQQDGSSGRSRRSASTEKGKKTSASRHAEVDTGTKNELDAQQSARIGKKDKAATHSNRVKDEGEGPRRRSGASGPPSETGQKSPDFKAQPDVEERDKAARKRKRRDSSIKEKPEDFENSKANKKAKGKQNENQEKEGKAETPGKKTKKKPGKSVLVASREVQDIFAVNSEGGEMFLASAALRDDYMQVKGSPRLIEETMGSVERDGDWFIQYPSSLLRKTTVDPSLVWCASSALQQTQEKKERAQLLRASVDSALTELAEGLKARSQSQSDTEGTSNVIKTKKKKKLKQKQKKQASTKLLKKKLKKLIAEKLASNKLKKKKKDMTGKKGGEIEEEKPVSEHSDPPCIPLLEVAPPLSAGGMAKLFSMAGYGTIPTGDEAESSKATVEDQLIKFKSEKKGKHLPPHDITPKNEEERISSTSPGRELLRDSTSAKTDNKAKRKPSGKQDRRSGSASSFGLRQCSSERTVRVKISQDRDGSPAPVEDEQLSFDRRTSPRLPKMRDSRSPVMPVMRDQRSPIPRLYSPAAVASPKGSPHQLDNYDPQTMWLNSSARRRHGNIAIESPSRGRSLGDEQLSFQSEESGQQVSCDPIEDLLRSDAIRNQSPVFRAGQSPYRREGSQVRNAHYISPDRQGRHSPENSLRRHRALKDRGSSYPEGAYSSDGQHGHSPRRWHGHPDVDRGFSSPARRLSPSGEQTTGGHYTMKAMTSDQHRLYGSSLAQDLDRKLSGGYQRPLSREGSPLWNKSPQKHGSPFREERKFRKASTNYDREDARSSSHHQMKHSGQSPPPGQARYSSPGRRLTPPLSPGRRMSGDQYYRPPTPPPLGHRRQTMSPMERSPRGHKDGGHEHRSPGARQGFGSPRRQSPESYHHHAYGSSRRRSFSPRQHSTSPKRRYDTGERYRSPPRRGSPGRRSPGRWSPGRRSPGRRSPARRSPGRRSPARRSPGRRSPARRSPGRRSPDRRSPFRRSPGRGSPRRRSSGRRSPFRRGSPSRRYYDRHSSPSPPQHRRGYSPRRQSPERYHSLDPRTHRSNSPNRYSRRRSLDRPPSPADMGRRFSPTRGEVRPDSTISDLDSKLLGAAAAHQYQEPPPPPLAGYSGSHRRQSEAGGSPKRLSLDERLERELGIKMEQQQEQQRQMPPPAPLHTSALPATVPTYDSMPQPTMLMEKEQAMAAAQLVTTKLLEMQAAKEAERRRKREQRLAERQQQLLHSSQEVAAAAGGEQRVAGARILQQVEQQELASEEQKLKKPKKSQNSPTLITLKPFYRPHERKGKKRPEPAFIEEEEEEEVDVKRSPVPLPDNSTCTPVLVKLGFGVTKSSSKKTVQYKDGVRPGMGSPDRSGVNSRVPSPIPAKPPGKKYKQVVLTVVTQHAGDTDSEDEAAPPPPPPPGSPPRYHTRDLMSMYGKQSVLEGLA